MSSSEGARVISTKSVIIALVGLAIIVGAVLFVFRYEYVVVRTIFYDTISLEYIVRFNRFTQNACYLVTDNVVEQFERDGNFLDSQIGETSALESCYPFD